MSTYETLSVIIEAIGIIGLACTIIYAARQLRMNREIHEHTLDWSRVTLTEEELAKKPDDERKKRLNTLFWKYVSKNVDTNPMTIPLKTIKKQIKKDKAVQQDIHHVLNRYERICRGIKNRLYDEDTIKDASKLTMIKVFTNYEAYIQYRQEETSPNAWILFKRTIEKWKKEE